MPKWLRQKARIFTRALCILLVFMYDFPILRKDICNFQV